MADERLGASFSIDVTALKSGLAQANRLIRESESEFKAAAAGMDNWTKSEAGLTAKIKSLNEVAEIQQKKVDALTEEYEDLIRKGVDPTSAQMIKLRTDINNQKAALEKTKKEANDYTEQLEHLGDEADEAGDAIEDSGRAAEKASGGFTIAKGALANLVAEGFKKAISAAKDFAKEMITTAAEVKAANSQFSQAFGELEDQANEVIGSIAQQTGILETRLQSTGAGIYSFARSSGATTSEAMQLMQDALMATADSAAYYDRSLEDSAETLQSFLKGNFANDAALGVSATEFTRNAKAAELFGKKYNDLSEIEKQKTLLKMVTDSQKLSGAMGQAARESDGFENVMGNVNETYKQFQAKVGTPVLEGLIPVIQDATAKFQKFEKSIDWTAFNKKATKTLKDIIKTTKTLAKNSLPVLKSALKVTGSAIKFVAENFQSLVIVTGTAVTVFKAFKAAMAVSTAITAAKTAIAGLSTGIGIATKAQTVWNAAMSANPIGAVITAVGLLAGGIAVLVASQDKAKESTDFLNAEQREAVTAANEAAEAYRDTKAAADEMASADVANIEHTRNLWGELQTLADENGKVREGYEGRAQYILNDLNEALGTEYGMNDGIIQQYGEMKKSIEDLIEAKKAQMLIEAYEETYKEAINAVSDAEQARTNLALELSAQRSATEEAELKAKEKRAEYEKALEEGVGGRRLQILEGAAIGYEAAADREIRKLAEKEEAYNEANGVLAGYYSDIAKYDEANAALLEGNTAKAISILSTFGDGFKTAASTVKLGADEQKKVLEQQVIDTEINAKLMEKAYNEGVEGVTEQMVKTAQEQAENAKKEFKAVGGDITWGMAKGAEDNSWVLNKSMRKIINEALIAAQKAADAHSPSRLFKKKVGKTIGWGVAVGVDDSTKLVVQSVKNQVKAIQRAYNVDGITSSVGNGIAARPGNNTTERSAGTKNVVVNQYNTYSQAHSRYELYKSKQQIAAAVRLAGGTT